MVTDDDRMVPPLDYIQPPWTEDEVAALNEYQQHGDFHPFTCPNRDSGHDHDGERDTGILLATHSGWVCRDCGYTQEWAHRWMAYPERRPARG